MRTERHEMRGFMKRVRNLFVGLLFGLAVFSASSHAAEIKGVEDIGLMTLWEILNESKTYCRDRHYAQRTHDIHFRSWGKCMDITSKRSECKDYRDKYEKARKERDEYFVGGQRIMRFLRKKKVAQKYIDIAEGNTRAELDACSSVPVDYENILEQKKILDVYP